MRINHNLSTLNSYNKMIINKDKLKKNMEKLSSGLRINRASDDAAGLAISEKMRGKIRGLEQAADNVQDGISLIQTAEGALNETHAILQRLRELAVQSANDTNTAQDREHLQKEVDQLVSEMNHISENTQFNNMNLLDGLFEEKIHIGANADQNLLLSIKNMGSEILQVVRAEAMDTKITNFGKIITIKNSNPDAKEIEMVVSPTTTSDTTATIDNNGKITVTIAAHWNAGNATLRSSHSDVVKALKKIGIEAEAEDGTAPAIPMGITPINAGIVNVYKGINILTQIDASNSITVIDQGINAVSSERAKLGAIQNRLEHCINNLSVSSENLTLAESRIRDVDMAKEMMEMTKNNVLQQASQSMLVQANQNPEKVLELLR